jgi:acetyl esterase/lipase
MKLLCLLMSLCLSVVASGQEKPASRAADEVVKIWQEGDWKGALPEDWKVEGAEKQEVTQHMGGTLTLKNISEPLLEYYKPAGQPASTRAVIVCPGGGYHILAWDLEGTEVAAWLSSLGYHAFVLKYRLPRGSDVRHAAALQDAQRAISLVRSRAGGYGIAPDQIGIMGFSAGAHLSALAATQHGKRSYTAKDAIDAISCRPDFAGLIYPAYLLVDARKPDGGISPELPVAADTPPCFLVHAMDDPLPCANSTAWVLALQKLKVPAELHIYADGGHGYGLRSDKTVKAWSGDLAGWLASGAGSGKK